jgi:hypothetical protein
MKKGTQLSYPPPPPPLQPPPPTGSRKSPIIGLVVSLIGGAIIFLAAIVYLIIGNPVAGILGIVFVILIIIFANRGYRATDKKSQQIYGAIPMFIGFIVMIASGTLLAFDLVVLIGGFLTAIGGALISAGK